MNRQTLQLAEGLEAKESTGEEQPFYIRPHLVYLLCDNINDCLLLPNTNQPLCFAHVAVCVCALVCSVSKMPERAERTLMKHSK